VHNDTNPTPEPTPPKRRLPILARHAVSLAIVFALAIPVSYFVGQRVHQHLQLSRLKQADREAFEDGLGYVYRHAGTEAGVADRALQTLDAIEPSRASDLLATLATSYTRANKPPPRTIPTAYRELAERLSPRQAIGLYDALYQVPKMDTQALGDALVQAIELPADASALDIVALLEHRLLWSESRVPTDSWLTWLTVLASSGDELTQHQAARRLGELPELADDPRVREALTRLADSEHDSVRAMVLNACAGYAKIAEDTTGYEQVIFELGDDANKVIARRAWLIVGHLNPLSGYAVNWKDADPFVAEAMLWAAVKTNPGNHKPAVEAIIKHGMKREGLLALEPATNMYLMKLEQDMKAGELVSQAGSLTPDFTAAWRAILSVDPFAGDHEYWVVQLYNATKNKPYPFNAWTQEQRAQYTQTFLNRYLAVTYRFNEFFPPENHELSISETALAELAAVEGWALDKFSPNPFRAPRTPFAQLIAAASGIETGSLQELVSRINMEQTAFADLMTIALMHDQGQTASRWLRSGPTPLKSSAVLATGIIGERPEMITGITANFLRENPDIDRETLRAMTDAELAEHGLSRVDALTALLEAAEAAPPSADRSGEAKLLRLGLWMRGDLGDDFTPEAEAMLFDDELPTSTVLMALLHKQRPIALEYLFGDLVRPRPDLGELFIGQRFWHVFRRFVDTADLPLWLWGDPEAQAFQLEAMRQWYAVNRWKIERGWWPEPQANATADDAIAE